MTADDATTPARTHSAPFWLRELPYLAILALTALGVAYVSMMRQPIVHYWDALAVFIFLVAMNMVFLPSVQSLLNSDSTSLLVLFQLALGTFVAGVHTASVKLSINGIVMALMVPAIAWLDRSALMLTIIATVVIAAAAIVLWRHFNRAG